MSHYKQLPKHDESEIKMLKEWLLKLSGENRAYIKGASRALLYAQKSPIKKITGIKAGDKQSIKETIV
jgi:hypothetical protein